MPTYALARLRAQLASALAAALGRTPTDVEAHLQPAAPPHGELALRLHPLATPAEPPPTLAARLAREVALPGMKLEATGPFLNARLEPEPFAAAVLAEALAAGPAYGSGQSGAGQVVAIDFSSPNIAKPIAFHHLRSTMIGNALANLHRAHGYQVHGINYLGDWGKQFGLVAAGLQAFGDPARKGEVRHLLDVYVQANDRARTDPAFDDAARAFFRQMELGDPAALALWQELRATSVAAFERIYARLGVRFEHWSGESHHQAQLPAVLEAVRARPGVKESEGALVVDLPYPPGEPPVLLQKSDGATLYATRDLAAAIDRHARLGFDRALYVVAQDQALHFRQVFRVLGAMGHTWADRCQHVAFGRVHGMSTRHGQVVELSQVLDEAREQALPLVTANAQAGVDLGAELEVIAEQVGLGAVLFGDLKKRRLTDYQFDWSEVLNLQGDTGPNLQYAHARTRSLLKKGGGRPASYQPARLTRPEEREVVRQVALQPLAVQAALEALEPALLARQLLDLGGAFNRWYARGNADPSLRILVEGDPELRDARLALTAAAGGALAAGLALLGIPCPEGM